MDDLSFLFKYFVEIVNNAKNNAAKKGKIIYRLKILEPGFAITIAPIKPIIIRNICLFETFTVLKGKFLISWNDDGSEEIILNELDTISIPPGVCRSFKNISDEEGLLQVIISGGIHDMNDIAFTKVAKDQMEKIESNLSKKFEDVGFKFNAGLNN